MNKFRVQERWTNKFNKINYGSRRVCIHRVEFVMKLVVINKVLLIVDHQTKGNYGAQLTRNGNKLRENNLYTNNNLLFFCTHSLCFEHGIIEVFIKIILISCNNKILKCIKRLHKMNNLWIKTQ